MATDVLSSVEAKRAEQVRLHQDALSQCFARVYRFAMDVQKINPEQQTFKRRIAENSLLDGVGQMVRQLELAVHGLKQQQLHECFTHVQETQAQGASQKETPNLLDKLVRLNGELSDLGKEICPQDGRWVKLRKIYDACHHVVSIYDPERQAGMLSTMRWATLGGGELATAHSQTRMVEVQVRNYQLQAARRKFATVQRKLCDRWLSPFGQSRPVSQHVQALLFPTITTDLLPHLLYKIYLDGKLDRSQTDSTVSMTNSEKLAYLCNLEFLVRNIEELCRSTSIKRGGELMAASSSEGDNLVAVACDILDKQRHRVEELLGVADVEGAPASSSSSAKALEKKSSPTLRLAHLRERIRDFSLFLLEVSQTRATQIESVALEQLCEMLRIADGNAASADVEFSRKLFQDQEKNRRADALANLYDIADVVDMKKGGVVLEENAPAGSSSQQQQQDQDRQAHTPSSKSKSKQDLCGEQILAEKLNSLSPQKVKNEIKAICQVLETWLSSSGGAATGATSAEQVRLRQELQAVLDHAEKLMKSSSSSGSAASAQICPAEIIPSLLFFIYDIAREGQPTEADVGSVLAELFEECLVLRDKVGDDDPDATSWLQKAENNFLFTVENEIFTGRRENWAESIKQNLFPPRVVVGAGRRKSGTLSSPSIKNADCGDRAAIDFSTGSSSSSKNSGAAAARKLWLSREARAFLSSLSQAEKGSLFDRVCELNEGLQRTIQRKEADQLQKKELQQNVRNLISENERLRDRLKTDLVGAAKKIMTPAASTTGGSGDAAAEAVQKGKPTEGTVEGDVIDLEALEAADSTTKVVTFLSKLEASEARLLGLVAKQEQQRKNSMDRLESSPDLTSETITADPDGDDNENAIELMGLLLDSNEALERRIRTLSRELLSDTSLSEPSKHDTISKKLEKDTRKQRLQTVLKSVERGVPSAKWKLEELAAASRSSELSSAAPSGSASVLSSATSSRDSALSSVSGFRDCGSSVSTAPRLSDTYAYQHGGGRSTSKMGALVGRETETRLDEVEELLDDEVRETDKRERLSMEQKADKLFGGVDTVCLLVEEDTSSSDNSVASSFTGSCFNGAYRKIGRDSEQWRNEFYDAFPATTEEPFREELLHLLRYENEAVAAAEEAEVVAQSIRFRTGDNIMSSTTSCTRVDFFRSETAFQHARRSREHFREVDSRVSRVYLWVSSNSSDLSKRFSGVYAKGNHPMFPYVLALEESETSSKAKNWTMEEAATRAVGLVPHFCKQSGHLRWFLAEIDPVNGYRPDLCNQPRVCSFVDTPVSARNGFVLWLDVDNEKLGQARLALSGSGGREDRSKLSFAGDQRWTLMQQYYGVEGLFPEFADEANLQHLDDFVASSATATASSGAPSAAIVAAAKGGKSHPVYTPFVTYDEREFYDLYEISVGVFTDESDWLMCMQSFESDPVCSTRLVQKRFPQRSQRKNKRRRGTGAGGEGAGTSTKNASSARTAVGSRPTGPRSASAAASSSSGMIGPHITHSGSSLSVAAAESLHSNPNQDCDRAQASKAERRCCSLTGVARKTSTADGRGSPDTLLNRVANLFSPPSRITATTSGMEDIPLDLVDDRDQDARLSRRAEQDALIRRTDVPTRKSKRMKAVVGELQAARRERSSRRPRRGTGAAAGILEQRHRRKAGGDANEAEASVEPETADEEDGGRRSEKDENTEVRSAAPTPPETTKTEPVRRPKEPIKPVFKNPFDRILGYKATELFPELTFDKVEEQQNASDARQNLPIFVHETYREVHRELHKGCQIESVLALFPFYGTCKNDKIGWYLSEVKMRRPLDGEGVLAAATRTSSSRASNSNRFSSMPFLPYTPNIRKQPTLANLKGSMCSEDSQYFFLLENVAFEGTQDWYSIQQHWDSRGDLLGVGVGAAAGAGAGGTTSSSESNKDNKVKLPKKGKYCYEKVVESAEEAPREERKKALSLREMMGFVTPGWVRVDVRPLTGAA
eukprot:g940.t1